MGPNKQPVFTDIPILVSQTFDPPLSAPLTLNSVLPTEIFAATDEKGSLIERITVSATSDPDHPSVTAKLIYLAIYDANTSLWSLYKTATMPATTVDAVTADPEVEWVFTGGLLLPFHFKLGIAASTNYVVTGQYGDQLAVTVEGSSYTQV